MKRLTILAPLAALAALAASSQALAAPRTITVNGTGIVTTVPNQAEFNFGVSTTARTAQAALAANAAEMNRVIAALKGQGLTAADLQTAEILADPEHEPERDGDRQLLRLQLGQRHDRRRRPLGRHRRRGGSRRREPRLRPQPDALRPARARAAGARGGDGRRARTGRGDRPRRRRLGRRGAERHRAVELDPAGAAGGRARGESLHAGRGRNGSDRGGHHRHLRDRVGQAFSAARRSAAARP